jgi:hypothetical protein
MSLNNFTLPSDCPRHVSLALARVMSHHSASSSSAAEDEEDTVMTYPDDADEKPDSAPVRYPTYDDGLPEVPWNDREHDHDEDEDDSDNYDSADYGPGPGRYSPVHHVSSSLQSGAPLYQQQYHSATYPHAYSDDDDDDVSIDGGAPVPPVDILSIAGILSNDMDEEYYHHTYPYLEHDNLPHDEEDGFDAEVEEIIAMSVEAAAADPDLATGEELAAVWIAGPIPPPHVVPIAPEDAPEVQQQLAQLGNGDQFDDGSAVWLAGQDTGPTAFVNPNMSTLSPGNYPLIGFLQMWAGARPAQRLNKEHTRYPWFKKVAEQAATPLTHVQYADLEGNRCDFQGMDWDDLGVTRREARERRLLTYTNYTNEAGSDRWHVCFGPHAGMDGTTLTVSQSDLPDIAIPRTDSFFRFRRMDIRRNIRLAHFQLRNVLAATSRTHAFYTGNGVVHRFNPVSGESKTVMKLSDYPYAQISTLAAAHGVLVAGCFNGEYMLQTADHVGVPDDELGPFHSGVLTDHVSGITNHIQVHLGRGSSSPRVAFASNDTVFRVLDVETNKMLSAETFEKPINCTAISPDGRLRVMVGDSNKVLITAADSPSRSDPGRPEILHQLSGHRDFGFACDWADDGWTIATGFQDKTVKIWDARRLGSPVETIRADMAGVRSLHFSPVGSGKRVLVAAEEADYVNIIDARTFRSKQSIDLFGEIGGTHFVNDGRDLMVLCCDRIRGGIMTLERCGIGGEMSWDGDEADRKGLRSEEMQWRGDSWDWGVSGFNQGRRVKESLTRRRRRGAGLEMLEPF